jgi:hypothetical protein
MERRFSMKFLGIKAWPIWLALLAMLPAMLPVRAESAALRIEALVLSYDTPYDSHPGGWQRADPTLENEALLLNLPQAGLQLAVLRHTRVLKTDAQTYFDKLSRNWRARHGQQVPIGWFESGERKWLYCQHAAQDGEGLVWQLSSVVDGRAYSVLIFGPRPDATSAAHAASAIPAPARELIAGARFDADPLRHADVSRPHWVKTRTLLPHASAEVLEALVQDDIARLGRDGLLTGYGLDFGDSGASWFVEGYVWKTLNSPTRNSRVEKVAINSGGRLEFDLPAATAGDAKARLRLGLNKKENETDNEADVGVQLRVWQLCAASGHLAETLRQLRQGAHLSLRRLAQSPAAGCPPSDGQADATHVLLGERGKSVETEVVLALPPAVNEKQQAALARAGLQRLLLVEIAAYPRPGRTGYGDRLIERARGYVVFEPAPVSQAGSD